MQTPRLFTRLFTRPSNTALIAGICLSLSSTLSLAGTQLEVQTNKGNFQIELFDEQAPETVKNFLRYVDEGFYEGTIFHRLIPGFMIQGGGFSKELTKKKTHEPIKNEAKAELKNKKGTLAMARMSAPHSATSQFFINYADNTHLDFQPYNMGYAVFGQVDELGMEYIDSLAESPTGRIGIHKDVPMDAIEILKISRIATSNEEAAVETNAESETINNTDTQSETPVQ